MLEQNHVTATFFVIGKMLRYFATSTAREIKDGDVIGDHTETHPMMAELSAHDQYEELFEQIARIELLGGRRPVLFRPPYGSFDSTTLRELKRLHLLMVLWSTDTDDYEQPGVEAIEQSAIAGAHPGAIILMHDAGHAHRDDRGAADDHPHPARARLPAGDRATAAQGRPPPAGQPLPPTSPADDQLRSGAELPTHSSQAPWITISCSETRSCRRSLTRRIVRSRPASVKGSRRPQLSQTRWWW